MSGNEFARGEDPDTSHRAVERLYPNLAKRRKQCVLMVRLIGRPCTRSEIRAQAMANGYETDMAESIRRRATDLIKLGILEVVDGTGDREYLWFKDGPATVIPLHGNRQDPSGPKSPVRRPTRRGPGRFVPLEDLQVHDEGRIVRGCISRPRRQRPEGGGAGPHWD